MNKCVVITGASRGIGLELARKYAGLGGYDVVACCRTNPGHLVDSAEIKVVENVDVTQPGSLDILKNYLGETKVDLLINNAGILHVDDACNVADKVQDIRDQFEVNSIGPLMTTLALRPNFGEGSRVAIIGSRMGSISDNTSGSYYGYRMSKAAVNQACMSLSRDLAPEGVIVQVFHPGFVDTDMTARSASDAKISPDTSAKGLVKEIEAMSIETTGMFKSFNGEIIEW